ncbi:MAG: energy-coupling factor transporter transmembrane protein EcfT [Methanolinea sp.]|nr:energy-coupling factor transporter transmembrane protein EcfT [Methanolinea sp.]
MAEILQYVHKDGLFHRMHPGTKIVFVLVFGVITILTLDISLLCAILGTLLLLAFTGRILMEVLDQMKLILAMSSIFILITLVTMPGGDVLGYLIPGGFLPVTAGALTAGIVLTLRFAILIVAFQIFVITTQPRDLVNTLERAGVPIDYNLMFLIALRFIPTLQGEAKKIHEAQLARGYKTGRGFSGRIRSVAPVMVPLVSNALSRANVLGITIDMRGYRSRKRTPFREERMNFLDMVSIALLGVTFVLFIARSFSGPGG